MNSKERKIGGADIVWKVLIEEGVDTVFGYPGGSVLPLYDALSYYQDKIRHVLVRHEQAASMAADGYARASGKVGVCFATSGPGATNLITGIANAYMDSIPMVAITGQVPSPLIGTDGFQEIDIAGVTIPITKQNYVVEDVNDLPRILKEAFFLAREGRPGPVLVDLPKDIAAMEYKKHFDYGRIKLNLAGYKPNYAGSKPMIMKAISLIEKAKKPIALIGHGVILSEAYKELEEFVRKCDIPVISTILGHGAIPYDHPNYYGIIGMHGMKYCNEATTEADLLIGIGIRFDDRITGRVSDFASKAKIIHIDIDPAEIRKIVPAEVPIVGDIKKVLVEINKEVKPMRNEPWNKKLTKLKEEFNFKKVEEMNRKKGDTLIHHGDLLRDIFEITKGNALMVTDVGQHQMLAWQYYPQKKPRKWLTSGGLGAMGYGLPAAMGAKLARPKEDVWLIVGDGGMQMNIQELMTLVQDKINIKICIFNNFYLGMVRQWQEMFYEENYSQVNFLNPDYVKIADAYGIKGYKATTIEEAKKINREIVKLNEPVIVDYHMQKLGNVFPMVTAGASLKETRIK